MCRKQRNKYKAKKKRAQAEKLYKVGFAKSKNKELCDKPGEIIRGQRLMESESGKAMHPPRQKLTDAVWALKYLGCF